MRDELDKWHSKREDLENELAECNRKLEVYDKNKDRNIGPNTEKDVRDVIEHLNSKNMTTLGGFW